MDTRLQFLCIPSNYHCYIATLLDIFFQVICPGGGISGGLQLQQLRARGRSGFNSKHRCCQLRHMKTISGEREDIFDWKLKISPFFTSLSERHSSAHKNMLESGKTFSEMFGDLWLNKPPSNSCSFVLIWLFIWLKDLKPQLEMTKDILNISVMNL